MLILVTWERLLFMAGHCRKGVNRVPDGRLHSEHYTLIYMVNVVRQAAGSQWWPDKIMLQARTKVPRAMQQEAATDTVFSLGKDITRMVQIFERSV